MNTSLRARSAALLLAAACGAACTAADDAGSSADQLKLEGRDLPTSLTNLRAGQPFVPGLDETLVEVGKPCIDGAEVTVTGGAVLSSASVVQSRDALERELGLDISGVIPQAAGVTGSIGLSQKTTFDHQSAVVLMQATGTYKTVLSKVASDFPKFASTDVSRCGYGYVTEASHRVTAALVVTVRSNSDGSELKANAGIGKSSVADAKATLSNIISRGNIEVTVRFATDVIPNLPNAPIGQAVITVGSDDAGKQQAVSKINDALNWLGGAHSAIQNYLNDLQLHPADVAAAPTQSVRFRFYPSTPDSLRKTLEYASANANAIRMSLGGANVMTDTWTRFGKEADDGAGYTWNIPAAPLGSIDELRARKRELLEDNGGKLTKYRDQLDEQLDSCVQALRNDANETDLAGAIAKACASPPNLPFDKNANELRELVFSSVSVTSDNSGRCSATARRPFEQEAKLMGPWSRWLKAKENQGIWMEKSGCKFSSGWIYGGVPGCTPFAVQKRGKTICVDKVKGWFPND